MVVEHPEQPVEPHVDAGRLDQRGSNGSSRNWPVSSSLARSRSESSIATTIAELPVPSGRCRASQVVSIQMFDRMPGMATWAEFAAAEPALADGDPRLIDQYGPGLAYLATIRPDGGPRIHPVSPVITDEGLYCFIDPNRRSGATSNATAVTRCTRSRRGERRRGVPGRARPPVTTTPGSPGQRERRAPRTAGRLAAVRVHRRRGHAAPAASSTSRAFRASRRGRPAVRVWLDPNAPSGGGSATLGRPAGAPDPPQPWTSGYSARPPDTTASKIMGAGSVG